MLTYAAPVVINGTIVNVGVAIQFQTNGRPRVVNVGLRSGGAYKFDIKKAPKGPDSRVGRYSQGTALPTMDAYGHRIQQPEEIVKSGDEGATFEENGAQHSLKSLRHDITEGRMFDDLVAAKVFNRKEADLLKQNLDKLVSYMLPNAGILNMNEAYGKENRPYSAYKPNSDPLYVISLDFCVEIMQ